MIYFWLRNANAGFLFYDDVDALKKATALALFPYGSLDLDFLDPFLYISGSLFSVFRSNSCQECQFSRHVPMSKLLMANVVNGSPFLLLGSLIYILGYLFSVFGLILSEECQLSLKKHTYS